MAKKKNTATIEATSLQPKVAEGKEIIALVDSLDKANQIANELNITLIRFELGVATYHTTKDPVAIVKDGKNRGYEIGLNTIQDLIGPVDNKIVFLNRLN